MTAQSVILTAAATALVVAGIGGCCHCPTDGQATSQGPSPRPPGRYAKAEAETRATTAMRQASDETVVESDQQEEHWSGVGGIHFEYYVIHYRSASSECYSLNTIYATAFTVSGETMYCGLAPVKAYQTVHIKKSDIVP